ncbi:MAG: hypothetical protein WBC78_13150 [Candidatus Sulfotelmatobacter sp.]
MDVKLTVEESDALIEILEERDRALQNRISHTRRDTLKENLKEKENMLEVILRRLEEERTGEQDFSDLWW